MITIRDKHFSVRQICQSGQCFRLEPFGAGKGQAGGEGLGAEKNTGEKPEEKSEERYSLIAFGTYLDIRQCGEEVTLSCSQEDFDRIWKNYFDLEEDYGRIIASIDPSDTYLLKAADFGSGIRILRQELWEMIISFIISQQNNIKRIRRCIDLLCRSFGERKTSEEGVVYYAFPTVQALAQADIQELAACNLGYRSKYVKQTAESIWQKKVDLERIAAMNYAGAMTELQRLCGVGRKVADCVCLFALHMTDAFPVDTHINRVLKEQYPKGFPFEKYPGYAGSLQQYIFYYDLAGVKPAFAATLHDKQK